MDDRFLSRNDGIADNEYSDLVEHDVLIERLEAIPVDPEEINFIESRKMPPSEVNNALRELLNWERAPMMYVREMILPKRPYLDLRVADDDQVAEALRELIEALRAANHVVLYADHLSDRRLYDLLIHEVLNADLKYLPNAKNPCYWNFCFYTEDCDYNKEEESCGSLNERVWLTFYANETQRGRWSAFYGTQPPVKKTLPHRREYLCNSVDFY